MPFPHRNSRFVLTLILTGLVFVTEAGWLYFSRQAMQRAEIRVKAKQRDLQALARVNPAPQKAVADAIARDVRAAEATLAEMESALSGGEAAAAMRTAKIPGVRTDAYFDLVAYRQAMRAAATRQGVAIAPEEYFGFAAYANEGPEIELIPAVFRQRQFLAYLLETLFAAQPRALKGVWRSVPTSTASSERHNALTGSDFFVLAPMLSVQRPGFIRTSAFRIEFSGETAVLRNWLNQVASFDLPLVVRTVAVEPPSSRESSIAEQKSAGSLVLNANEVVAIPLVQRRASTFTVTIESVELMSVTERSDP